jgi:hypothetical protein
MTTQDMGSERDVRAQKRTAIGLAPTRPTAKSQPQRPPQSAEGRGCLWSLVLLVVALLVVTLLLVSARLMDSPVAWPQIRTAFLGRSVEPATPAPTTERATAPAAAITADATAAGDPQLLVADEFTNTAGLIPGHQQPESWTFTPRPEVGVYQMAVQPAKLGWSTIGIEALASYRAEASLTIAPETAAGYTGFVARLQDESNFYLFAVDGVGRFQVQLLKEGRLQTLLPWSGAPVANRAGEANELALIDNGRVLRLFVNGVIRYEEEPQLSPGDLGLFAAAPVESPAQVSADWVRVYRLPAEAMP